MFFILSKILAFIITPLVWIIVLLFFSVFSKDQTRKKKYIYWALGVTLFFSNSFIFDESIRLWEIHATHYYCLKKAGIIATPYSTDRYSGPRKFEFDHLFIPNLSAMMDWNNFIKEIIGFITYKIVGYA